MVRKSFFDLFPPPQFLSMPAAGISINEDAIRFLNFKFRNGVVILTDFGEEKLPEGSIESGAPAKKDQIISVLRKLKHGHGITYANVALPEDKAYVFKANVSVPKGANLADSVGFILEENIPLSPAETVFDFAVVRGGNMISGTEASAEESQTTSEVVVSALPQETVEAYLDICKQADINVLQFDIESEAVARSVVPRNDTGTRLIVHFNLDKVVLAIVSYGLVQFASVVNPAAETSVRAVESRSRENLAESVELIALRDEIKKICLYWQSNRGGSKQKTEAKIESIIVSGQVDQKLNITSYLSKHIGLPTDLANVWQNAFSFDETIPKIPFEDSLRFAGAIGLALPAKR